MVLTVDDVCSHAELVNGGLTCKARQWEERSAVDVDPNYNEGHACQGGATSNASVAAWVNPFELNPSFDAKNMGGCGSVCLCRCVHEFGGRKLEGGAVLLAAGGALPASPAERHAPTARAHATAAQGCPERAAT